MSSIPAVELFTTSILSNHKVRHRHERYLAVFAAKRIDYVYHDLASDEEAKKRFRRKALDQQIPNVLVHNEWRGTFEEFEEAVEFGELDLFLRIDPSRVAATAAAAPASESSATATTADEAPSEKPASSSSTVKLPPAPTAMPKMAPQGSGAGPKRNSMDEFLDSLDAWKPQMESMSEADLSALLDEGESSKARHAHAAAPKAPRDARAYPGHRAPQEAPQIKRTYFPTEAAGTRPLRLPKMGDGAARAASSPVLQSSPSFNNNSGDSSAPTSPRSPGAAASGHTRFSVSQNSSRALAAEASASASHRTFSARQLRSGLDSGRMLQDVMGELRDSSSSAARSSRLGGAGGEADALLEELGLADLKLTDEEAEAFLLNGAVPDGLELGGSRTRRGTAATKAREQEAARDVADKARSLAEERRASASVAKVRKEREREESERGQAAAVPAPPPPADISSKTRELLERAKEKRASRQIGLASGQQGLEGAAKLESLLPAAVVGEKAEKAEQEAPPPAQAEDRKAEEQTMSSPSEGKLQEEVAKAEETDDAIVQAGDGGKAAAKSSAPEDGAPLAPTSADDPSAEPSSSTTEAEAPPESTPAAELPSPTPPATSTPPKDNVEPPVAADTEADATPKVRQSVLPAFTAAAAAATPAAAAATPTTTSSGDDEEIDDLFARLSGLGENQRFSSVLAPAPAAAASQGLVSTKEVALAEEDEAETQIKDEDATSPNGKAATDAATTPPSPPAASVQAAGTLTPSASSNIVGPSSSSSLSPSSGKGSTDNSMVRSLSTTSNSSASSSAGAGNAPPSASSSSTRRSNAGSSSAPSTPGSRRGMDLTRKPSNLNVGGLAVASPIRSSSVSTSGSGSGHSPASPPPEGYYGSIPAAAVPMSPKSPTLKARLKSFGSLAGRKSTSSNASGGAGRVGTPASPPASASKMSVSSNGGGHDADWRSQRTLSQILRDADAAMADDDEDGDGVGGLSGAGDGGDEAEEDDGLGSAEIKI